MKARIPVNHVSCFLVSSNYILLPDFELFPLCKSKKLDVGNPHRCCHVMVLVFGLLGLSVFIRCVAEVWDYRQILCVETD